MNLNTVLLQLSLNNYKLYTEDNQLNIIGIRSNDTTPNVFNDEMCVFWYEQGEVIEKRYKITTDPGFTGMVKPVSSKGVAILVEGQYVDVYKIDKHKGRYDALCQRGGMVKVYRDNDKDAEHDMDSATIEEGWFGINIHRAKDEAFSTEVNGWSHGCQVFANDDDFEEFMELCAKHANLHGNKFTYTLLKEHGSQV